MDWLLGEGTATDQPHFFIDTQSPKADATNGLPDCNSEKTWHLTCCDLQPWYSSGIQEFSPLSPIATARPQLSGNESSSYTSTLLDEESQPRDQSYSSPAWSHNISRQLSSMSDGAFARIPSNSPTIDLTQELDSSLSHSSKAKELRCNTGGIDVSKKQKITHSVVDRNYRSRMQDGMVELRHCVPLTARG